MDMNRWEFMRQLEYLLRNIPESERNDALAYYHNYFDEAGVEYEQDVIRELGSPENVAQMILADYEGMDILQDYNAPDRKQRPIVYGMKQEDTNFQRHHNTDNINKKENHQYQRNYQNSGYDQRKNSYENQENDQKRNYYEDVSAHQSDSYYQNGNSYEKNVSQTTSMKKKMSTSQIVLIVLLIILTFPIWIGIVAGVFGAAVGLLGAAFGVIAGLGGAGIGMVIGSIICIGAGVLKVLTIPAEGFAMIGVGALLLSISILLVVLFAWMVFRWIPALIKPLINWIKGLFQRLKGGSRA